MTFKLELSKEHMYSRNNICSLSRVLNLTNDCITVNPLKKMGIFFMADVKTEKVFVRPKCSNYNVKFGPGF